MQELCCIDIMKNIESVYPTAAACDWDNVGLLAGDTKKIVKSIYVALDATDEVVQTVIEKKFDMLITHHPLIYHPLKRITTENFIEKRIWKLIRNDISYYAMHTNYDILGMADIAGKMIGLKTPQVLEVIYEEERTNIQKGIGRIGVLKESISLEACCNLVKEKFQLEHVSVYGDLTQNVKRVAISPGSGKSMITAAMAKGADVLITGDIDYHSGIDAKAQKLAIIDAGHYGIEHIFVEHVKTFLNNNFADIKVEGEAVCNPVQFV